MKKRLLIIAACLSLDVVYSMQIVPAIERSEQKCAVIINSDKHSFIVVDVVTPESIFSKRSDFTPGSVFSLENVPIIGRINIDERGILVLTNRSPGFLKVSSAFDIDVDCVSCSGLNLTAPSVAVLGECAIPEFFVNITGLLKDTSATIHGVLLTGQMKAKGGKIVNRGGIRFNCLAAKMRIETENDFINEGEVSGNLSFAFTASTLINKGSFIGDRIGFCVDVLDNQGEIGSENAYLKFIIHKRMLHVGGIIGKEVYIKLGEQRSFLNGNILQAQKLMLDGPNVFINNGVASVARLFGTVRSVLNCGRMDSPRLSLIMDVVKNQGFMKLWQLEITRSFLNLSEEEDVAVFLSECGIKFAGSADSIENTRMINTARSIPSEEVAATTESGLTSCCRDGYIINARPGFWPFDVFDFERMKTFSDFCVSVESQGDSVLFFLFHRGSEAFSKTLSTKGFNAFADFKGDFFYLYKHNHNVACRFFNPAYDVWYDFAFDFKGNIELSLNEKSTTGVEHEIKYAFRTNGVITNKNPLAFDSLIIDSRSLRNLDVLKVKNYFFRYAHRYNSGVLDLKRDHSPNTDIALYKDKTFTVPTPTKPSFKANSEDNYGVVIGDDTVYFGSGSNVNFYGITLFNSIDFAGEGNSARIQDAIYDVSGSMSGKLGSFIIKSTVNSPSSVIIGRLRLLPMKYFETGGVFLMRESSKINARNVLLTGVMSSSSEIDITYGQMVGGGTIASSESLILSKQTAAYSFPDDVKFAVPRIIKRHVTEHEERIFDGSASPEEEFIADLTKQMETVRKGGEILEELEVSSIQRFSEILTEHGSSNRIFIDLKKIGLEQDKIARLLALPYFYANFDLDLQILRLHKNISSNSLEKNATSMLQKAILWRSNADILSAKFPDYFRDYFESWKKARERRDTGIIIGLGMEKFVNFAEKEGKQKIAGIVTENVGERQHYISTFDCVKQIIEKNLDE